MCLVFAFLINAQPVIARYILFWWHCHITCMITRFLILYLFLPHGATTPIRPGPPHYRGFTIALRHTTLHGTPLDEWSARRRDLHRTTHNTPAGFEPAIPASEEPQTHALDGAAVVCCTRRELLYA
jgi:hypothetical protein